MEKRYDIVSIGHITRDVKVVVNEETPFVGGAAYFSSLSAARSGAQVLVITKVAPQDADMLVELREAGIDVINLPTQKTTSMHNIFPTGDMDHRELKLVSLAEPFTLDDIPEDLDTEVFHIASLFSGEFPQEGILELSRRGKVALDLQAVIRSYQDGAMVYGDWPDKQTYLPCMHFIKADSQEIKIITGCDDRVQGASKLHAWGAREVVITGQGEVLASDGTETVHSPITAKNYSGRVGRGDTCFLAYISRRLTHTIEESVRFSAALTSIKMESPGPFSGTVDDILARMTQ